MRYRIVPCIVVLAIAFFAMSVHPQKGAAADGLPGLGDWAPFKSKYMFIYTSSKDIIQGQLTGEVLLNGEQFLTLEQPADPKHIWYVKVNAVNGFNVEK